MEIQALGGLWNISLQIFYENAFPIWDVLGCTFPTTYVTYFSRTLYIPTQGSVRTLSHHQYSPRDALKVLKFNPSLANMRVIKKGSVNEQIAYALEKETWPRFYLPLAAA